MTLKAIIFLLILFLSVSIFQDTFADTSVVCQNGTCSIDPLLTISNETDEIQYTKFEIEDPTDNINFSVDNNESPRDVRVGLSVGAIDSYDIDINFSSSKDLNNSGEVILIADSLKDITLVLNGRNGSSASDAKVVCSEKILADDYGVDVKNEYLAARIADALLPANECVTADLLRIGQNQFACPADFVENAGSISSTRWKKKRECHGDAERKMCVQKKLKISCKWVAQSWTGHCLQSWQKPKGSLTWKNDNSGLCIPGTTSGWYVDKGNFIITENYYLSQQGAGKTNAQICDTLTSRGTSGNTYTYDEYDWKGAFSGSYRSEDLNTYLPSDYLFADWAQFSPGSLHWESYNNSGYLSLASMADFTSWSTLSGTTFSNFRVFKTANRYIHTHLRTKWNGSSFTTELAENYDSVNCNPFCDRVPITTDYANTGTLDNHGWTMYKETNFNYWIRYRYLDAKGYIQYRQHNHRIGHF